jgi:hypothetical protein
MIRSIAAAVGVGLAVALAGCKDEPKPPNLSAPPQPNASDLFDNKPLPFQPGPPKKAAPG